MDFSDFKPDLLFTFSFFGHSILDRYNFGYTMGDGNKKQKTVIIGAGPVGTLAAIYAAQRGHDVEVYELRSGTYHQSFLTCFIDVGLRGKCLKPQKSLNQDIGFEHRGLCHGGICQDISLFILCSA